MLDQSMSPSAHQPILGQPVQLSFPPPDNNENGGEEGVQVSAASGVRLMMPLVLLGTVVVIIALLFLRWPSTTSADLNKASTHFDRIASALSGEGNFFPNAVMDISIYIMVIVSIVLMASAFRRGARNPLNGLMIVGLLGLAYTGGMALYTGPMVSICGFTLILFAGAIAWIASSTPTGNREITEAATVPVVNINTSEMSEPATATERVIDEPTASMVEPEVADLASQDKTETVGDSSDNNSEINSDQAEIN